MSSPLPRKKIRLDDTPLPLLLPESFFEISKHLACAYELRSMLLTCKQWYDGIMQAMVNIDPFWVQRDFPGSKVTYIETLKKCVEVFYVQTTQTQTLKYGDWKMEVVCHEAHSVLFCSSNGYSDIHFTLPDDMKPSASFGEKIMQILFLHPSSEWLIRGEGVGTYTKVDFFYKIALAANGEKEGEFVSSQIRWEMERWIPGMPFEE
jgi:hypothetical protein